MSPNLWHLVMAALIDYTKILPEFYSAPEVLGWPQPRWVVLQGTWLADMKLM